MMNMTPYTVAATQAMAQQRARQKTQKRATKEARKGLKHLQKAQAMGLDVKISISLEDTQIVADLVN